MWYSSGGKAKEKALRAIFFFPLPPLFPSGLLTLFGDFPSAGSGGGGSPPFLVVENDQDEVPRLNRRSPLVRIFSSLFFPFSFLLRSPGAGNHPLPPLVQLVEGRGLNTDPGRSCGSPFPFPFRHSTEAVRGRRRPSTTGELAFFPAPQANRVGSAAGPGGGLPPPSLTGRPGNDRHLVGRRGCGQHAPFFFSLPSPGPAHTEKTAPVVKKPGQTGATRTPFLPLFLPVGI